MPPDLHPLHSHRQAWKAQIDLLHSTLFEALPDIMSVQQVRQVLKVGRPAVYHLLSTNQIECFKIGNAYKVPKVSLIDYIQRNCAGGKEV